jgi:hypothetical protein
LGAAPCSSGARPERKLSEVVPLRRAPSKGGGEWVAALSACLAVSACGKSDSSSGTPAPAPGPQTSTARLVVSRGGSRLGKLELPPGKPVVLTLESEGPDAAKLKELTDKINASDTVAIEMHLPPEKEGTRGAYGAQLFRRGNADYPKGVEIKLISEGYSVQRAE